LGLVSLILKLQLRAIVDRTAKLDSIHGFVW